ALNSIGKRVTMLQSILTFLLAACAEVSGVYAVWQWVRAGRHWLAGILGTVLLLIYALLQTTQPFSFGRAFAAYGGVFIAVAMLWGWLIDGRTPDGWDWLGVGVCLAGVLIMIGMPRAS